jgi:hypothetical protein
MLGPFRIMVLQQWFRDQPQFADVVLLIRRRAFDGLRAEPPCQRFDLRDSLPGAGLR